MKIIPFKQFAAWQEQISLTDQLFILYFKWNANNEFWVMSIYDLNSLPIILGIKLVSNYNLTKQFSAIPGMPLGDILCQNIIGENVDIGRFDMGQTTELIYYEPNEISQLSIL